MSEVSVKDSDGFVTVSKKKSSKNSPKITNFLDKLTSTERHNLPIDIDKAKARIFTCLQDINCLYFKNIVKSINSTFPPPRQKVNLVSFGLGNIGEDNASRYQFAFLISLRDEFKTGKVYVHDPLFSKDEITILKDFKVDIIEENTEGCFPLEEDCDLTIVYLPHCALALTNNFLWSNWSRKLEKCVLICNSFSNITETRLNKDLATYAYFHKISQYTDEFVPENNFKIDDIFNHISVHTFPVNKVEKLPEEFWQKDPERPKYEEILGDFITADLISKLQIK